MGMKTYEIWMEGFACTGASSGARLLGKMKGKSFKDACAKLALEDENFKEYYDSNRQTFWGCRLFDNQIKAIRTFG